LGAWLNKVNLRDQHGLVLTICKVGHIISVHDI